MAHEIIETGIVAKFANQGSGLALWRKRAAIQDFIDIDVAKARNNPLIKQGSLQGSGFFSKPPGQKGTTEFIAQRFNTDISQQPVACQLTFTEKVHDAEAAMIRVNNARSIIEGDDHVVMGTGTCTNGTRFKVKLSQIVGPGPAVQNRKTPGHPEMHQKVVTVIEVNQNILGPPMQSQNLPALQSGGKIRWKGKTKSGSAKVYASNGMPDENGN